MAAAFGGSEFVRAFQNAVQYALASKFLEKRKLKPVQEEAVTEFIQPKDVVCCLTDRLC